MMTTASAFDYAAALDRADAEIVAIIGEDFLGLVPADVDEMRRAAAAGNHEALGRLAHTYKGLAGNFGAQALVESALAMQNACRNGSFEPAHLAAVEHELGALCAALRAHLKLGPG